MSAIPPNWISSTVGGLGASERAGQARSKSDAAQARNVDAGSFADKLQNTIENEDADAQVDSEAEGRGSQGRAFSSGDESQEETTPDSTDADVETGGGLDLQA